MPSLAIPESGLSLDNCQRSDKSDSMSRNIISLTLSDNVIGDMIKCVRNGKSLELSLGNEPKIIYGSQTQNFTSTLHPFPCDYFRTTSSPGSSLPSTSSSSQSHSIAGMSLFTSLWGSSRRKFVPNNIRTYRNGVLISQTAATPAGSPPKNTTSKNTSPDLSPIAGADAALATLRSSLASEDARKKDNTTKHVKDTSTLPPAVQQRGPAKPIKGGNKARFLSQGTKINLSSSPARSMPTSPALTGISSPALVPTSVPLSQQQAERAKAIRGPIIHRLALNPATEDVISKFKIRDATEQEFKQALEKVAEVVDGKWKLKQKSFRELDVFAYKRYTPEERQIAIENAIHIYDKLRLSNSEPEWDRLLPMEERGTGKCLSKLQAKIAVGAIQPAAKTSKAKMQEAEDSGRDTAIEDDGDDLFGEKTHAAATKGANMARSHSNPPATKRKKTSEKELQAKRLLTKGKPAKSTSAKSSDKKSAEKDSTKIKSSKFVHESDEEDDSPLLPSTATVPARSTQSKTKGSSVSQTKSITKAARDDTDGVDSKQNLVKKHKVNNTSPQKSSPLASTPTNASDIDDSSSSSLKNNLKRKATDSSSDVPISKRHQKSSSNSTTSSIAGSMGVVNGDSQGDTHWNEMRHNISETRKFNLFYNSYLELYQELSATQHRDVEKMADLRDMHERLVGMKANILSAAAART